MKKQYKDTIEMHDPHADDFINSAENISQNAAQAIAKIKSAKTANSLWVNAAEEHRTIEHIISHMMRIKLISEQKEQAPFIVAHEQPLKQSCDFLIKSIQDKYPDHIFSDKALQEITSKHLTQNPKTITTCEMLHGTYYTPYSRLCMQNMITNLLEQGNIDHYAHTDHPRNPKAEDDYSIPTLDLNNEEPISASSPQGMKMRNQYAVNMGLSIIDIFNKRAKQSPIIYDMQGSSHSLGKTSDNYRYNYLESKSGIIGKHVNIDAINILQKRDKHNLPHNIPQSTLNNTLFQHFNKTSHIEHTVRLNIERLSKNQQIGINLYALDAVHIEKEITDALLTQLELDSFIIDDFDALYRDAHQQFENTQNLIVESYAAQHGLCTAIDFSDFMDVAIIQ